MRNCIERHTSLRSNRADGALPRHDLVALLPRRARRRGLTNVAGGCAQAQPLGTRSSPPLPQDVRGLRHAPRPTTARQESERLGLAQERPQGSAQAGKLCLSSPCADADEAEASGKTSPQAPPQGASSTLTATQQQGLPSWPT